MRNNSLARHDGAGRGDIVLGIFALFLLYLLYSSGFFTAAAWEDFNRRFYQNFIKDRRYMMMKGSIQGEDVTIVNI